MPRTLLLFFVSALPVAAQEGDLKALLAKPILPPRHTLAETQKFIETRLPSLPKATSPEAWDKEASRLREEMFRKVIFRGAAAKWHGCKQNITWFDAIPGGPEYQIKKLRFEVLPGLWVPAVLYEPLDLKGKVPATLNVMGHDRGSKDVAYQQIRCINLAKRGMLALNVEWFAFGQLSGAGFQHGAMNQLDLCGTSGLAPFYLSLERSLDVLLSHPHADPKRVAVSGLSGGGWQTIYISALDPRVTLSNPVAGYSSFRTRIKHWKDLGDSEQTPCDMATVANYDHLTAMLGDRAALLTYNAKDNCCFEAGYALPPLYDGALPFFQLHKRGEALRTHVNHVPGTHNFEVENREAFYRMIGDRFFPGDKSYQAKEIACAKEVRNKMELAVPMPANLDFNKIALALSKDLPRTGEMPTDRKGFQAWQKERRAKLADVVHLPRYAVIAEKTGAETKGKTMAVYWKLKLGTEWTLPVVELTRGPAKGTTLIVHDAGRSGTAGEIEKLLQSGRRVLAVDPFYVGESRMMERDYLWALLVGTVGQRPLGIQAAQIHAVAAWSAAAHREPLALRSIGERSGLLCLTAAALETEKITGLEMTGELKSLKQVIESNRVFASFPEAFCFGLLEEFDLAGMRGMAGR